MAVLTKASPTAQPYASVPSCGLKFSYMHSRIYMVRILFTPHTYAIPVLCVVPDSHAVALGLWSHNISSSAVLMPSY